MFFTNLHLIEPGSGKDASLDDYCTKRMGYWSHSALSSISSSSPTLPSCFYMLSPFYTHLDILWCIFSGVFLTVFYSILRLYSILDLHCSRHEVWSSNPRIAFMIPMRVDREETSMLPDELPGFPFSLFMSSDPVDPASDHTPLPVRVYYLSSFTH